MPLYRTALVFAILTGLLVLDRLEAGLARMHGEEHPSGGFGTVASPGSVVAPSDGLAVLRGWRAWAADPPLESLQPPGPLLGAYALVDLALVAVPLFLLLRWAARRSPAEPGGGVVAAVLGGARTAAAVYLAADVVETASLALLWHSLSSFGVGLLGAVSLLKLVALGLALAGIAVAWRERARAAGPRVPAVPGGRARSRSVALRGQAVVLALLLGVLVALSGNIGFQVDDVVVRAASSPLAASAATLAAAGLALVQWAGGRAALRAYADAPGQWALTERAARRLLAGGAAVLLAGVGVTALTALDGPLSAWASLGAPLAVAGAGVLLLAVLCRSEGLRTARYPQQQVVPEEETPEQEEARLGVERTLLLVLATAGPLALVAAILRAVVSLAVGGRFSGGLLLWALVMLAVVVLVGRLALRHSAPATAPDPDVPLLRWGAAAGAVVLLGFLADPVWTMPLGTVTVLFAGALALSVVVTALVLLGDRFAPPPPLRVLRLRRMPVLALVVLFVAATSVADREAPYYDVRLRGDAAPALLPLTDPPGATAPAGGVLPAWLAEQQPGPRAVPAGTRPTVPLVLVAGSGGGIRGAYWTALTMECLFGAHLAGDAQLGPVCPATPRASGVFLASGVSGSSVGLAMLRAEELRRDALPDAERAAESEALADGDRAPWLRPAFDADYVAPAVAATLFRDLPNSALRLPLPAWNRAASLERAWQERNPRLVAGTGASGVDGAGPRFPLLLFNGTSVEDGCRVAVSPLRLAPSSVPGPDCLTAGQFSAAGAAGRAPDGVLAATEDALTATCPRGGGSARDVRLSTAALLSARFPYVSPSGALLTCTEGTTSDERRTYVLDGGLLENSGADALVEVWAALEPQVRAVNADATQPFCVVPRLLLLDNSFADAGPWQAAARSPQLLAPAAGALGVLGGQASTAQQEAQIAVTRAVAEFDATVALPRAGTRCAPAGGEAVAHLFPRARPGSQAPLGWTLAEPSRLALRTALCGERNLRQLAVVDGWFGGGSGRPGGVRQQERECAERSPGEHYG
ncbi:hypothetical protein CLV92_10262 [Kineococcus xinjiangensis]|uniref:Patatin-like phospholipase n=1 Tax=Kineococcus xinjiangensis TaxID=512762 RepID=A0A2S6IUG3_9ACTN|nr:hypothetical protein [Kineococcus xinjiangensis]PPK97912.1 hypothetical protein CLV92_10262 [Kineococcus xinjiangensis]